MRETRRSSMHQDEEIVRRTAETFGRALAEGDLEPYLELLAEDVEFEIASPVRGGVVELHGRGEVRGYLEEMAGEYTELVLTPQEIRERVPGRYLVLGTWHGRVHGGASFGTPLAAIISVREGKVARMQGFMDEAQALAADEA
jgi:ketosteroid isomerase-like protein